ncbi:hypothetical protein ACPOL_2938 [Acidisarcina polymorpha]|uniref:Uncharacterized protein n=1 Tax=Acidisarcina polymorpha TaxID=2211140 RepID=A0A2Z5FZT6_9BACT|nr:hypothetical protein [Acidisarcina polymorpha]AXC12240.1 hypothetical protein ACPOL_2938 [Acidisarcina polymorpha]
MQTACFLAKEEAAYDDSEDELAAGVWIEGIVKVAQQKQNEQPDALSLSTSTQYAQMPGQKDCIEDQEDDPYRKRPTLKGLREPEDGVQQRTLAQQARLVAEHTGSVENEIHSVPVHALRLTFDISIIS